MHLYWSVVGLDQIVILVLVRPSCSDSFLAHLADLWLNECKQWNECCEQLFWIISVLIKSISFCALSGIIFISLDLCNKCNSLTFIKNSFLKAECIWTIIFLLFWWRPCVLLELVIVYNNIPITCMF